MLPGGLDRSRSGSTASARGHDGHVQDLRDLAERLTDGRLDVDTLSDLPDDQITTELTAISGIGPWTVQGALILALHREDVVLPGELAAACRTLRARKGWLRSIASARSRSSPNDTEVIWVYGLQRASRYRITPVLFAPFSVPFP